MLVDGTLDLNFAGAGTHVEMRTLAPKRANAAEPDAWSAWQTLASGAGRHAVELGRPRFNGRDNSIHGVYRFQLRVSVDPAAARPTPAGLSAFRLDLFFENGIMSVPQIFAGRNTMRFRVRDAARLSGPVEVRYRYRTAAGEQTARHTLRFADFRSNEAVWDLDAPGLTRCDSLAIFY